MIRSAKVFASVVAFGCACFAQGQQPPAGTANAPDKAPDKASAYYNFAMGRLYEELADGQANDRDYVSQAIKHFQEALKADPTADAIFEELTDLYVRAGRLSDAVTQAEGILKQSPDNLQARRMLGRIYARAIPDSARGSINEANLRNAIAQFEKVTEKDPKDAESWVMLGRLYKVSNKSPEAEKAYEQALKLDPESEEALTGLAMVYADLGDTKRAIDKLKAATDKAPNERTLAALASAYEQMQDFKSAAEVLKRAMEAAPDNGRLVRGFANDLFLSEQFDEALQVYERIAKDEPRDPGTRLRIAEIYRGKRDYVKAQENLNRAKALSGDSMDVRYEEVNLLQAQGKTPEAIAALKKLVDETTKKSYTPPESANRAMLLDRLGTLYLGSEQYPLAVEAYRQIVPLTKDSTAVTVQIIETYRAAKDFESAQREVETALKKGQDVRLKIEHANVLADRGKVDEAASEIKSVMNGENDLKVLFSLAQILEKGKRWNEMAAALDQAEKLAKSKEEQESVHFMRGAMYERQKKFEPAEAEFRKVLAMNPESASALNYLGYMLADHEMKLDEANTMVTKALELDPENGAYLDSLAWVYYRQGKLTEAQGLLERALEKIKTDPTVHDHLGDVYIKLGKTREAITQWQASLKGYASSSQAEADPEEVASVSRKLENARVKLAKENHK